MALTLHVNEQTATSDAAPDTPLLYILRNDLALNGPKSGCGLGQCGGCQMLVDGRVTRSCVYPTGAVRDAAVTTVEGLGTVAAPHPLQKAFLAEQAAQCGYCTSGMLIAAKALLDRQPDPSDADVRTAFASTLCRCGAHSRIVRAVLRAAKELRS